MEMTKKEQTDRLSKFERKLKRLGLKNKMRVDSNPEHDWVVLEIASKNGSYEEQDSYVVTFNKDCLDVRFCYAEHTTIIDEPTEEEIIEWLKKNDKQGE